MCAVTVTTALKPFSHRSAHFFTVLLGNPRKHCHNRNFQLFHRPWTWCKDQRPHVSPQGKVQWRQIRASCRPLDRSVAPNPSPRKHLIKEICDCTGRVWWCTILLEPERLAIHHVLCMWEEIISQNILVFIGFEIFLM